MGLKLYARKLKDREQLSAPLGKVIANSDFILARKDPSIYNPESIRTILLSTYRNNRIVVGLSKAYVNAGIVASTYSSSEQQLETLEKQINYFLKHQSLLPPSHTEAYSLAINRRVANSMDLVIPTDEQLLKLMVQHED